MRVFSLAIAVDVLQLVDDDRDGSGVAVGMGGSNGEREMKSRRNHLQAMCLGYCLSARVPCLSPLFDQSTQLSLPPGHGRRGHGPPGKNECFEKLHDAVTASIYSLRTRGLLLGASLFSAHIANVSIRPLRCAAGSDV